MKNVKIVGYGSAVPENILTNTKLSEIVETTHEWIEKRTGICERRISTGQNTSDLASIAAMKALKDAKIDPIDIDLIIVATSTPDYIFPSTACVVQKEIGAINATCFDLEAACTGFVYALDVATQYLKLGRFKNAIIIGAEVLSKVTDWSDRGTCILFGDGAGAAIVSATDEQKISEAYTKSDGTKGDVLKAIATPVIDIYTNEKMMERGTISMNGQEVFKFACNVVLETVQELLVKSNLEVGDIDHIVLHQANSRIIEYVAGKLNVDIEKTFMNLNKYGNTSAASIPLALDEMSKNGMLKSGQKVMMIGFGGGLTWGGILQEL